MLRRQAFEDLVLQLSKPDHAPVHVLANDYGVTVDSVLSIKSFEVQRHVSRVHSTISQHLQEIFDRYSQGEAIADLAAAFDCPPCYLLRRVMEIQTAKNNTRGQSTAWMRPSRAMRCPRDMVHKLEQADPPAPSEDLAFAKRWSADLIRFASLDPQHSAYGDVNRYVTGRQMEAVLYGKLKAVRVPLWTEQQLRQMGFHKTPDAYLQVPIRVKGRLVRWIDSKAAYGSPKLHWQQMEQQYQKYIDRFGPGAVIYWFGYVEELQAEGPRKLLLLESFPHPSEISILPSLAHLLQPDVSPLPPQLPTHLVPELPAGA